MERPSADDFWIARGELPKDAAAVDPGTKRAGRYDAWTRACLQRWTMDQVRERVGRSALTVDLGCGFGDWSELLAGVSDELVACDLAPGFVAAAKARLAALGHPRFRVEQANVRAFEPPAGVHLAYIGAVLMYLDDADSLAVLRRLRERMRPDGVLVGREWCAIQLGRRSNQLSPWFSVHRRPEEYAGLAEQAGFRVVEMRSSLRVFGEAIRSRWGRVAQLGWSLAGALRTRASVLYVMAA